MRQPLWMSGVCTGDLVAAGPGAAPPCRTPGRRPPAAGLAELVGTGAGRGRARAHSGAWVGEEPGHAAAVGDAPPERACRPPHRRARTDGPLCAGGAAGDPAGPFQVAAWVEHVGCDVL